MDPDLELALRLADTADAITLARFRAADLRVTRKPDRTPVTDADTAVEDALRRTIAMERPGDAVLGEERGGAVTDAERGWVLDPIDGTKNFSRGMPAWATLIALSVRGEPTVGVASAPALGRRWWAARGEGAWTSDPSGTPRPPDGPAFLAVDVTTDPDPVTALDTVAALCEEGSRAPAGTNGFVCRFQGGNVFAAVVHDGRLVTLATSAVPPGTTATQLVVAFDQQVAALGR